MFKCSLTEYLTEEQCQELLHNESVFIYNDYLFCLSRDKDLLSKKYLLHFTNISPPLFDLFLDEFSLDEKCCLDMRWQYYDLMRFRELCNLKELINEAREIFAEILESFVKDYESQKHRYMTFIKSLK